LVGYLILTRTCAILAIKFYLLLFVMELDSRATEKEGELRKGEY
jgi:preprotein translocase subunit SecG